jgi:CheY-like chemotaxis protein
MNSLLVNLLKMLRRLIGEQIQLDLQDAPEELWVKADPGMVEQVVMNLVVNARDAMPLGGCVALHTKRVDFDAAPVAANPDRRCGRFVCLAVSDTGCGMDASTQQRIFEPFFTTKEAGKGTGLGLATVYSIAKQHQGWIEVESTLDRGTTFSIFLPAESKPVAKEGQSTQKSSLTGGGETLLLVEDEDYVRASERRILSELGYQVLEAGSVSVAKQIWEANQDRIALLITDMILPEGSTGLDLIEDLFKRTPTLKAILVSGYCAESSQARVAPSGRVRFLAKPLAARRLARAVRDLLGQESASIDAPA